MRLTRGEGVLWGVNVVVLLASLGLAGVRMDAASAPPAAVEDRPSAPQVALAARRINTASLASAPLFTPQRRPSPAPPAPSASSALSQPPSSVPVLKGVFGTVDGRWSAVLEEQGGSPRHKVEVGQTVAGWTVDAIEQRKVDLRWGTEVRALVLDPARREPSTTVR